MIKSNKGLDKRLIMVLLLPIGLGLNYLSLLNPTLTERLYADTLYKVFSQYLSQLTGLFPVSLAEVLIIAIVLLFIWKTIIIFIQLKSAKSGRFEMIKNTLITFLAVSSVLYFSFLLFWGFNYNRLTVAELFGYNTSPASVEELVALNSILVAQANELRANMKEDSDGVMRPFDGPRQAFDRAFLGFENAALIYPQLSGTYGVPKRVLLSRIMSYTNISGIYVPFTGEANVNVDIPAPLLLSTACHEMAHQRGIAREDEANYIAYVTCIMHPDEDFQYSGTLLALIYSLNALRQADTDEYVRLRLELSDGIKRDFAAIERYNRRYENPVGDFAAKTNDIYLKANNQTDGEKSYGRMVDLLIAQLRKTD
jgi:hypothetical protein